MGLTFVRWLHLQCANDPKGKMPYASIYEIGPIIEEVVGLDGEFDLKAIVGELRERVDGDYSEALVQAEATWRIDQLCIPADPDDEVVVAEIVEDPDEEALAPLLGIVPALRCGYLGLDGGTCRDPAVPGSGRCAKHGGSITDPEVRRSLLLIAYAKVIKGAETAVDALIDVAEYGANEMARVQAAKELLDRAGVIHEQHTQVTTAPAAETGALDVVAELKDRLMDARDRLQLVAIDVPSKESDGDGADDARTA